MEAILDRPETARSPAPVRTRTLLDAVEAVAAELGPIGEAVLFRRLTAADAAAGLRALVRDPGLMPGEVARIEAEAFGVLGARTDALARIGDALAAIRPALPVPVEAVLAQGWAAGLGRGPAIGLMLRVGGIHVAEVPGRGAFAVPFDGPTWQAALDAFASACASAGTSVQAAGLVDAALDAIGAAPAHRTALRRALSSFAGARTAVSAAWALGRREALVARLLPPGGPAASIGAIRALLDLIAPDVPAAALHGILEAEALEPRPGWHASRHGTGLPDDEARALAHRCAALVAGSSPDKPWTTRGLLTALGAKGQAPAGLDELALERCLVLHKVLARRGPMSWTAPDPIRQGRSVFDVIEAILVRNGGPMSATGIRTASRELTGTGFLPREGGRLVDLGGGLWGLVDRDLPIDPVECREVVAAARDLCDAEGGLTLARLREVLAARPFAGRLPHDDALRSLISVHGGVAVKRSMGMVRPYNSGDSFTGWILEVLSGQPDGISTDDLVAAVTRLSGAAPSESLVKGLLWREAERFGPFGGLWRLRAPGSALRAPGEAMEGDAWEGRFYPRRRKRTDPDENRFKWTPERVAILRRLSAEGVGSGRIIAELGGGVTRSAVIGKARRLGFTVLG